MYHLLLVGGHEMLQISMQTERGRKRTRVSFFWIKDSTVLAKGTPDGETFDPNRMGIRYPSAEDRELTIYDVTKNDEGTYTCHVTFKDGTTTVSSDQVRVESRIANGMNSNFIVVVIFK
uniref:Uncharacterized protein n=1 Tax=Magallana gigas TaxID=29159 RepID=K1QUI6_MAGGI